MVWVQWAALVEWELWAACQEHSRCPVQLQLALVQQLELMLQLEQHNNNQIHLLPWAAWEAWVVCLEVSEEWG